MKFNTFVFLMCILGAIVLTNNCAEAYHKHSKGHVKIKVWRGPSHGYKKHKYAPFGYHFSVDEKGY